MMKEVSYRKVECSDYEEGIEHLLDKFETYPDPIDAWSEYKSEDPNEKVVIVMTPIGDLWTFLVTKIEQGCLVELIGSPWLIQREYSSD